MTSQLGIEVLQLGGELFVLARLSRLALERANLPLYFAHQVRHPQQILLGVFEFPEGFFLLRLVFGNPGRFFENHPPILRFAGENLRNVPLGHNTVTCPPHAGAHEQLLHIFQPARRLIDKIFTASISENSPCDRHLVIGHLHTGGMKMIFIYRTDC